jgi:hypothetical protein
MRHVASGLFTVGNPKNHTGKANMAFVRCDLCKEEVLFDPEKVRSANTEIERIQKVHVCKKPVKEPEKKKKKKFQRFEEYEKGMRPQLHGPRLEDDDDIM